MLFIVLFFVFLLIMFLEGRKNHKPRVVKAAEAAAYVNRDVQIRGQVFDVKMSKDGEIHIHFGGKSPKQTFTAHIPATSELAGDEWVTTLRGQVIGIPGLVVRSNGGPTIEVLSMDQIVGSDA